jgi:hypothetical protein
MTNLTHISIQYVYSNSLHVSRNLVLISRRINFINITSGMCHSMSVAVSCAGLISCSSSGESILSI